MNSILDNYQSYFMEKFIKLFKQASSAINVMEYNRLSNVIHVMSQIARPITLTSPRFLSVCVAAAMLGTLPSIAKAVEINNTEADNTVENATTTPTPKTQANERIHRAAAPTAMLDTIKVVASNNDISEDSDSYVFENASTATGLALSPQYTPQSVTTITHQQIEDQDLEDVADVLRHTPGVSLLTFDGGRTMSSARGFDITQYQIDGQDVDFNGIWTKGEDFTSTAIFDRVEVVRGATGLTSGSGEPSASINLIRKRANSRNPEAMISVEGDHHGQYGATLDASTPLIEGGDIRGRFIAQYKDGDTFIDREEKQLGLLYGVVDADIGDKATLSIGASQQDTKIDSGMWGGLPAYYSDGGKTSWDVDRNSSVDWVEWDNKNRTYFGTLNYDITPDWQFMLQGSRSKNEADDKLLYLLSNTIDRETGMGAATYNSYSGGDRNQDNWKATVNGVFYAFGQTHTVQFGGSYNKNELKSYAHTATPNYEPINFYTWNGDYPEPVWSDKRTTADVDTKEKSLFASGRFQLTDPLALVLGTRVTDYDSEGFDSGVDIDVSHDDKWVPYVGATYDINDNHTVFASYTSIFDPQIERDVNNNLLDPVDGDNYELGIKSSNVAGTLQGQLSVFRIKQDNLAQPVAGTMIINTDPPQQAYIEADGATSKGVDIEVTGRINPDWQTSIGFTQFIAKDDNDDRVNPQFPDRVFKLFTTYDMSSWIPGLTVGGGINWSDERHTLLTNPATQTLEKYEQNNVTLVDIMARYNITDSLAAQLNVENLFDEEYLSNTGFGFGQINYGKPLTLSGKLSYTF